MIKLEGIDTVMNNLSKEIQRIDGVSLKGLIRSSVIVRRAMDKEEPKIPVDTGNLRSSQFTVTSAGQTTFKGGGFKGKKSSGMQSDHDRVISEENANIKGQVPIVAVGFTANYAAEVHEDMEKKRLRPGSGPKFLESKLLSKKGEILAMIAKEAKR